MSEAARRGPVVGVYDAEPDSYLSLIEEVVPPHRLRVCRDPNRLSDTAGDAEVLLAFKFPTRTFPRDALLNLDRLAWVQLASAGIDHILPYDPRRLTVTNASGIHGDTMAEYVLATLLHMTWDFPRLLRQQQEHRWDKYEVRALAGLTMGVIGVGHVGQRIGQRARAFGMRVVGTRRGGDAVDGFDAIHGPHGLANVLSVSDVVVLTLPLTAETRGMFGDRELRWIKSGAWLVNVSRGGIVQEDALFQALQEKRLAGAVLDVFAEEPLPPESPFWDCPNVLVTPHISSEFAGWPKAVARLFLDNLERWKRKAPLLNVVDPATGY